MAVVHTHDAAQAFWNLVRTETLPDLGSGPRSGTLPRARLQSELDRLLGGIAVEESTSVVLTAAALLYHDHHDDAHDLISDLGDPDSSLVHAILHRREPDFWNANYWFRRVSDHPAYRRLTRALPGLCTQEQEHKWAAILLLPGLFDPGAFVTMCESASNLPDSHPQVAWMKKVQHAEFEGLVSHVLGSPES